MADKNEVGAFRAVLGNLTDEEVMVVKRALGGFADVQADADEEVREDWDIDALNDILTRTGAVCQCVGVDCDHSHGGTCTCGCPTPWSEDQDEPVCTECDSPATCTGAGEGEPDRPLCDSCCGHIRPGSPDGACCPLDEE